MPNMSDDEKVIGGDVDGQTEDNRGDEGLLADPDAGLSDEERAAIVCDASLQLG